MAARASASGGAFFKFFDAAGLCGDFVVALRNLLLQAITFTPQSISLTFLVTLTVTVWAVKQFLIFLPVCRVPAGDSKAHPTPAAFLGFKKRRHGVFPWIKSMSNSSTRQNAQ
jgi:hypothetical protein